MSNFQFNIIFALLMGILSQHATPGTWHAWFIYGIALFYAFVALFSRD